ncbi:hypothetical protein Taro_033263 [Colocasia esculenta]|uniref:Uncharacterized protein n=1 Tax=Colocasia esculenta TaxID=4460 RepID=A0A843W4A5_COLES|nr:hypothetical protein [Colocasia esculenta]
MDCDRGCVAFLKATWRHTHCRLLVPNATQGVSPSQDPGLKPGRPSPSLSLAPLLSPSLSLALSELPAVLGCLPRVEAAVLRRVSLRSCRGRVRAVRALVVGLGRRGQFGVLPGAGQPVLLLTASLLTAPEPFGEVRRGTVVRPDYGDVCYSPSAPRPPRSVGGDHENQVLSVGRGSGSRVVTVGESSQQRQGARQAEETGR